MKTPYWGLCALLVYAGCDVLWAPFRTHNDGACELADPNFCGSGLVCDRILNKCVAPGEVSPVLTSVTPATGPGTGGTSLTLDGMNFAAGATVSIGGIAANPVNVVSANRITVTLPQNPGALGPVPVVVTNPDGRTVSRADLFSYYVTQISYGPMSPFPSGSSGPIIIGLGDFNSDGKVDVAAVHSPGISLNTLLGDGQGRFSAGKMSMISGGAKGLAVGDFNGDGRTDLAVAASTIYLFLGKADGSLDNTLQFAAGTGPVSLVAADFNRDGQLDLAAASRGSHNLTVLMGDGKGSFAAAVPYALGAQSDPWDVVAADFNRDGKLDLACADPTDGAVHILLGDGSGRFGAEATFATSTDQRGLAAGDFNNDGKLDLAVANGQEGSLSILLGDGSGRLGMPTTIPIGINNMEFHATVTVSDFDGDRNLDLAYVNAADRQIVLLAGTGTGSFPSQIKIPVGTQPTSLQLFDWNGDGKRDLTISNYGDDTVGVLLNTSR